MSPRPPPNLRQTRCMLPVHMQTVADLFDVFSEDQGGVRCANKHTDKHVGWLPLSVDRHMLAQHSFTHVHASSV